MPDRILSQVTSVKFKRDSPVMAAFTAEDIEMIDTLSNSTPFQPSRSEMVVVFSRATMHRIKQGRDTLEGLFKKYKLSPLSIYEPLSEMPQVNHEDEEILARYCAKHGLDWHAAITELLHKQLQIVKACNYLRRSWDEEVEGERKEA